jgi:hypothetical protein
MSHFVVVVRLPASVGDDQVKDAVGEILAPFHEFECTGEDDEYVQSIDKTAQVRAEFEEREDKAETLAGYVEGYYGWKPIVGDAAPNLESEHKYGWCRVSASGELVEAFDRTNPNKKWDWWAIGGRWSGYFPVRVAPSPESTIDEELRIVQTEYEAFTKNRTGAPGEHERYLEILARLDAVSKAAYVGRRRQEGVRLGRAGTFNNVPDPGHSDYVRKREIDWDLVAQKTREAIEKFHGEWARFLAGEKFDAFEGPRDKAMRIGLCEVRREGLLAGDDANHVKSWRGVVQPGDNRESWFDVCRSVTLETLLEKYADAFSPISGYAYLDETGWHEPGEMGWFGSSSDTPETLLKSKSDFTRWLKETPDDAWLVAVDCHT